jgi:preprotein translocase subunit SecF
MKRIYPIMFVLSLVLVVSAAVLIGVLGLNLGIDFKGGSVMDVTFAFERPTVEVVSTALSDAFPDVPGLQEVQVSPKGEKGMLLRSGPLSEDEHQAVLQRLADTSDSPVIEESFESIGPSIGAELKDKSIKAIVVLVLVVILYIAFVFRGMSRVLSPWAMGLAAIIALMHDLIVPIGVFAVLGSVSGIQITAVFVAAVLTILAYSLSDTVVVFDRVRENIMRGSTDSFAAVVHTSVLQTLMRSVNTTLTTLAALVAIWFFGGESLRFFSLALIIGIALGSYSSIFVATPLLVWFSRNRHRR